MLMMICGPSGNKHTFILVTERQLIILHFTAPYVFTLHLFSFYPKHRIISAFNHVGITQELQESCKLFRFSGITKS